jgi:LacI family transcriptional regulator
MKKRIGILTSSMASYFVKRIALGMQEALIGSGCELKVYELKGRSEAEIHACIEELATSENLAGLIYTHLRLNPNQVGRFKMRGVPVVGVAERMPGLDWIAVDEELGGYMAGRYLLDLGHRRLALVNGPAQVAQLRQREAGFCKALAEFGIRPDKDQGVHIINIVEDEGRDAARMLTDLSLPPTGIFVPAGDVAALGLLAGLREAHVRCPEEVSVIGFDNLEFAHYIYPPLSSINQPLETMGSWAVKRLLERMEDPYAHRPYQEVLQPALVVRESTAEPGGTDSLLEAVAGFGN